MYNDRVIQAVNEHHDGYWQVSCNKCFMAQEIPEPGRKENLTVYRCVRCDEINTVHHNHADWRVAQFWANVLFVIMVLLCVALVLGSVWWWSWVYL